MSPIVVVAFLAGLVLLVAGAEVLVRGASRLAAALGLPSLVIGLTVVAFGTSAPELTVSLASALAGRTEMAVGNVVGSNIFNVFFILGLAALITPLVVSRKLVRFDVPLMMGVSLLVALLALDGRIGRLEGLLLVGGLLANTWFTLRTGRRELRAMEAAGAGARKAQAPGPDSRSAAARAPGPSPSSAGVEAVVGPRARRPGGRPAILFDAALSLAGLALLVLGSRLLVGAATDLARWFGLSELIIGLTIVAAGTSLPEVAASVVAALRGERDIAVGNVVGSNIFNLLGVLGLTALLSPSPLVAPAEALRFDIPVMLAAALVCLPVFFTGFVIRRWEAALLLLFYAAYVAYLVLDHSGHDALPAFSLAMGAFVLPLGLLALALPALRSLRSRPAKGGPG